MGAHSHRETGLCNVLLGPCSLKPFRKDAVPSRLTRRGLWEGGVRRGTGPDERTGVLAGTYVPAADTLGAWLGAVRGG